MITYLIVGAAFSFCLFMGWLADKGDKRKYIGPTVSADVLDSTSIGYVLKEKGWKGDFYSKRGMK